MTKRINPDLQQLVIKAADWVFMIWGGGVDESDESNVFKPNKN